MSRKTNIKLKNVFSAFLAVALVLSCLTGCSGFTRRPNSFKTDKLHVVCTVYTAFDFTKNLLKEDAEIVLLMSPGVDVHGFEPSTDDMRLLEGADIIVSSGAGLETWLNDLLNSIDNKDIYRIDLSSNVELLTMGETVKELGEDEEEHEGENHEEHHDHHGHEHNANDIDPHIWMSPVNAVNEVTGLFESLKSYYQKTGVTEEQSERLTSNYNFYIEKLNLLKEDYSKFFNEVTEGELVVSHEAFGYLCHSYGLTQIAIDGLTSGESDAKTLRYVIDYIREYDIKFIFYEDLINPDTARVISEETGCELVALKALGSISQDDIDNGMDYINAMRYNLEALRVLK